MARQATRTTRRTTSVADVPTFTIDESAFKPGIGETALTTTTVPTPEVTAPGEALPTGGNEASFIDPAVTHAQIDATLHAMIDGERNVDRQRQRLAAQLYTRHLYLKATDATTPDLADLAMNAWLTGTSQKQPNGDKYPALYSGYLTTLVNDYAGPYVPERNQTTPEMREAARYRSMVNTRVDRSLRLLCNLFWLGRPDALRFDDESGRWFVPASAFVPHGWLATGQMLLEPDGVTLRAGIWLEPDVDTKLSCIIQPATGTGSKTIVQSLDQLTHAITSQIEASHLGKTAAAVAATKAEAAKLAAEKAAEEAVKAQRAPQMPGTRNTATPAADATQAGDDDDDADAGAPTGTGDRANYVRLFNQHVVSMARIISTGLVMSREDFTPESWNSYVEAIMFGMKIPGMITTMKQTGAAAQLDKANAAGRGKAA